MVPSRRVGERGRDLPSPRDHLSTTSSQHFRESRQQLHVTTFNFIDDDDSTHYPPPEQQQTTTMPQAQPELKKVREPFLLLRSAITTSLLSQKRDQMGARTQVIAERKLTFLNHT